MTTVTAPSSTEPRAASEPRVRRRRTKRPGWWVVAALLAAFAFLWVFPFIWMVSASLKTSGEIFQGGLGLIPEMLLCRVKSLGERWPGCGRVAV